MIQSFLRIGCFLEAGSKHTEVGMEMFFISYAFQFDKVVYIWIRGKQTGDYIGLNVSTDKYVVMKISHKTKRDTEEDNT